MRLTTSSHQHTGYHLAMKPVLVSGSNASEVLNRVYDFYQRNESIRFRAVIDAQELGDRVEVETGFKGKKTGTITKLNFQFSRHEITAEVTVQ